MRACWAIALRWTTAHWGDEVNEVADSYAKGAAESPHDPIDREYLCEASLAHLTRKSTEAKSWSTWECIRSRVKSDRRYKPPKGGKIRLGPSEGEKGSGLPLLLAPQRSAHVWLRRPDRSDPASAGAEPGLHRSGTCGGAPGRHVSGSTHGRRLSDCSSRTRMQPRRSRPSCGIPGSGEWSLWRPRRRIGRSWRIVLWPEGEEGGPVQP